MPCGHSIGYMYRIRDTDGMIRRWCFACMIEQNNLKDLDGQMPVNHKKLYEERKKNEIKEKKAKE